MDYNDDVEAYYRARREVEDRGETFEIEVRPGSRLDYALQKEQMLRSIAGLTAWDYSWLYRARTATRLALGSAAALLDAIIDEDIEDCRTRLDRLRSDLHECADYLKSEGGKFGPTIEVLKKLIAMAVGIQPSSLASFRGTATKFDELIDAGYRSVEAKREKTAKQTERALKELAGVGTPTRDTMMDTYIEWRAAYKAWNPEGKKNMKLFAIQIKIDYDRLRQGISLADRYLKKCEAIT